MAKVWMSKPIVGAVAMTGVSQKIEDEPARLVLSSVAVIACALAAAGDNGLKQNAANGRGAEVVMVGVSTFWPPSAF